MRTSARLLFAILLCLALAGWPGLVGAQPSPDECWLAVSVVDGAGTPFPTAPAISLFRLEGKKRIYSGRVLTSSSNTTTLYSLVPGQYEMRVQFSGYGLIDGPKTLELLPGLNRYEWRTPVVAAVAGRLAQPDAPDAAAPTRAQAFLMTVGKTGPQPVQCTLADGGYRLYGVFPGAYRVLVLTDRGYGFAAFTAGDDGAAVTAPITLQSAGILRIEVSEEVGAERQQAPLPGATVTLSCTVEKGFTVSMNLRTDHAGKIAAPALPPGTWKWSAYASGRGPQSGTVELTADTPKTLPIILRQPAR